MFKILNLVYNDHMHAHLVSFICEVSSYVDLRELSHTYKFSELCKFRGYHKSNDFIFEDHQSNP